MADQTEAGQNGFNLSRILHWAKRLMTPVVGQRRTTITIETERILIIKRRVGTRRWCPKCGRETDMITLEPAAGMTGEMQWRQRDFAKSEIWRMAEEVGGSPLICLDSLIDSGWPRPLDTEKPSRS